MAKKLIEEGNIIVGSNSIKHLGNEVYLINNSSGNNAYDTIAGDNPSSTKEDNLCSNFSKLRLTNIKKWKTEDLKDSFENALYLMSDTGSDAKKLANHFFTGAGKMFVFDNSTNLSKEIKESAQFKNFTKSLLAELKKEMVDGSLKQENKDGTYEILRIKNVKLPFYSVSNVLGKNDDAAAILGGVQLSIAKYKLYKDGNTYTVELPAIYFYDTFGAGWEDACNTTKSYANGLVSMFVLQHYRNVGDSTKYQPFVIGVEIKF